MNHKELINLINMVSDQKQKKEIQDVQKYEELKNTIFGLSKRIKYLIEVANVWEDKMHKLTLAKMHQTIDGKEISTGIMAKDEQMGFIRDVGGRICYLGFYGKLNLNSAFIEFIGESKEEGSTRLRSQIMKEFIDQFDSFESDFYRWVEEKIQTVLKKEAYIGIHNGCAIEIHAYSAEEAAEIANAVFESEGCEMLLKNQLETLEVYTSEFLIRK